MKKGDTVKIGGKEFKIISYTDWLPIKENVTQLKSKIVTLNGEKYLVVSTGHFLVTAYE